MSEPTALVSEVRRRIASAADPRKAPAMQAYMKSVMPFRGVQAGPLARLCREVYDAHPLPDAEAWRLAVLELWDGATHREERYAAIHLTGHRDYRGHQRPASLDLYRHLVVTGAWWDYVDTVASHRVGPILLAHRVETTPVVRAWAEDDHLWVRRTAILCQLGAREATDTDLLTFVIDANLDGSTRTTPPESPHGRDFFIRKAIGWALREHARTDPGWVRRFVTDRGGRLSGLSRREALKHLAAASGRGE